MFIFINSFFKSPEKEKISELPVHDVEETSTVTLTIEKPKGTAPKDVVLLKDGEELKPSDHVKITSTSPTTTEIEIVKVKPDDEGDYTVEVKGVETTTCSSQSSSQTSCSTRNATTKDTI